MALRNIVQKTEPILRKKTREVTSFDKKLHTLLDDMAQTMYEADGVGLAAPQVGMLRKVVVIDVGEGLVELINPVITKKDGEQTGLEGCLSLVGEIGIVTRPSLVSVEFQDRNGKKQTLQAEDFFARAVCHELDHLEGILYTDIAEKMLSAEEYQEYLAQLEEEEEE